MQLDHSDSSSPEGTDAILLWLLKPFKAVLSQATAVDPEQKGKSAKRRNPAENASSTTGLLESHVMIRLDCSDLTWICRRFESSLVTALERPKLPVSSWKNEDLSPLILADSFLELSGKAGIMTSILEVKLLLAHADRGSALAPIVLVDLHPRLKDVIFTMLRLTEDITEYPPTYTTWIRAYLGRAISKLSCFLLHAFPTLRSATDTHCHVCDKFGLPPVAGSLVGLAVPIQPFNYWHKQERLAVFICPSCLKKNDLAKERKDSKEVNADSKFESDSFDTLVLKCSCTVPNENISTKHVPVFESASCKIPKENYDTALRAFAVSQLIYSGTPPRQPPPLMSGTQPA